MKKSFAYKVFSYKDRTHEDVANEVDEKREISLKYNSRLVDRISKRYPFIPKSDIAVIVKECFSLLRSLIIQNNVIYLSTLFPKIYLFVSRKFQKNMGHHSAIKINIKTPKKVKKQ